MVYMANPMETVSLSSSTLRVTTTVGVATLMALGYMIGRQEHRLVTLEDRSAAIEKKLDALIEIPSELRSLRLSITKLEDELKGRNGR